MKSGFLLIVISILTVPFFAGAQFGFDGDSVDLLLSPVTPGANQTVTARITSSDFDIGRSEVSWMINGEEEVSGIGLRTFTFKTGNVGSKITLEVFVISPDGKPSSKSLTIYPSLVNLLSENESYTPPFYRGKAYFPYEGRARVVAIPNFIDENGKSIPDSSLNFNWKESDRNLLNSSGVGRNILDYKSSIPIRTKTISVEVSSLDNKYIAKGKIDIEPIEPKVLIYENDPEYGVFYNKALINSVNLKKSELVLEAIPYYFNAYSPDDFNLKYDWSLNGNTINSSGNSIVLKSPSGVGGTANLALQLSNTTDIFQFASNGVNINFGTAANGMLNPFSGQ